LNREQVVNLANGNVLTTIPITGWGGFGPPIGFALMHNSRQDPSVNCSLSKKWTHSYAFSLSSGGAVTGCTSTINVKRPDGTYDTYCGNSGVYAAPTGVYDTLVWSSGENKYLLTLVNQDVYRFDTSGKLLSITDPNGQAVTLSYDSPDVAGAL